ncbi:MAG: AAA domain-containing protein, partial [Oceanospirillales bacterium]|nr:AAA domain-containing protein [Oceanospirillales bacterium]
MDSLKSLIGHPLLEDEILDKTEEGRIYLLNQRMLLLHGYSLASLRREFIERVGLKTTREIFTRLGYQQGAEDALKLKQKGVKDLDELFYYGPKIREMEGFVLNRAVERMQYDEDTGKFWGDYIWESSWESKAHLEHLGISGFPACWLMTGYACGYTTTVMGRPILWKEVECVAMGHKHCRVIGVPLEDEEDIGEHLSFMQVEEFVSPPKSSKCVQLKGLQADDSETVLPDIVGSSRQFNEVATQLKKVAVTNSTVLLVGESGVGKERFARALHSISKRSDGPFVSVNCAAIPADLVESELFGVEKGAFTGAVESRPGRFERAHGGTLFLDEISSLPLEAQGKLLRALQEKEIERVGGTNTKKVNVRIVAAANTNLSEDVLHGKFRSDLYYRINIFPVKIPPLRERKGDIALLVNLFINRFANEIDKHITGISRKAFTRLLNHEWPGNVRELENVC